MACTSRVDCVPAQGNNLQKKKHPDVQLAYLHRQHGQVCQRGSLPLLNYLPQ